MAVQAGLSVAFGLSVNVAVDRLAVLHASSEAVRCIGGSRSWMCPVDQNSDDGFSQYVKQVRPELRRRAFLLCGDWFEADDLTQKTLVKVFSQWPQLDNRRQLSGFTRTVMVRTYISDRRAARWSREVLTEHNPEPEPVDRDHFDHWPLLSALDRLGHRQRTTIVLRYWEQLTVRETADALGCAPATVRSQTSRALATLRSLLRCDSPSHDAGDQDPIQKRHAHERNTAHPIRRTSKRGCHRQNISRTFQGVPGGLGSAADEKR